MKKVLLFLCILLMSMTSLAVYAQVAGEEVPVDYSELFTTMAGIVAITTFLTETIKRLLPKLFDIHALKMTISWLAGILICYIGWLSNVGLFENVDWWQPLLYGIGSGLIANGIFDTGVVTFIVDLFIGIFKKKNSTLRE